MRVRARVVAVVAAMVLGAGVWAQEREDRALLPAEQMLAIVNEASGERAMHHVLELVPYPRVRPLSEYQGHFRESEVMARLAKEYGFSNVEIESFPSPQRLWQPTQGELWITSPRTEKLYDIYDVAVSLAANSADGDVTAELVDVGPGTQPDDYAGKDVKGKIVLGSGSVNVLQRLAVFERGAAGVIGDSSLRPDDYPDEIPSSSIQPAGPQQQPGGFGWAVSPRVGRELRAMLARGERVALRSIVKAQTFPGELETVHATIPGDGSSNQDVIVSAHLYEGYIKQGANDDNSGCALTLEIGRAYLRLVNEGKLPKPKRTIHFLWVPEISGTNAWLNAHKDVEKRIIADLNFDMEGLRLSTSRAYWVMHRTPDTFPTFLNDVGENLLTWAAEVTRERIRYRANGYAPSLPIVAPNGSRDPFYVLVDKHYGASDHVTYMQHGIPALMFITWPDMWYHSSQDTPDKQDPTQYKRAAVVGIAAMTVVATGGNDMAMKVAAESLARGAERMGEASRKGLAYMANAQPDTLADGYREAIVAILHQRDIEKAVLQSAAVLFEDPADGQKRMTTLEPAIERTATAQLDGARAIYAAKGGQPASSGTARRARQAPAAAEERPLTEAERDASRTIVERVPQQDGAAGSPGRGRGFGGPAQQAAAKYIPQHMRAELNILIGQKKSALEIRDFLSGEFEPLPLSDLMAYLRELEKLGQVKLTSTAPAPAR